MKNNNGTDDQKKKLQISAGHLLSSSTADNYQKTKNKEYPGNTDNKHRGDSMKCINKKNKKGGK